MFDAIIAYSVKNKLVIGIGMLALTLWGIFSLKNLPIDAVPDITNNQVQIITNSPNLATQEVEEFVTTPLEYRLQNMQEVVEIRSISRFGLSVITVVFQENTDIHLARQWINQRIIAAKEDIPAHFGTPQMAPISTGLGEIYQYTLEVDTTKTKKNYDLMALRSLQDWVVKRQLSGIKGVVEINSFGGYVKQLEIAITPEKLQHYNIDIPTIFNALQNSNENTAGAYIEKNARSYYIRTAGRSKTITDIENIVVSTKNHTPIILKDIAKVQYGHAPRYGAMTSDGKEAVGGIVMMLKGANAAKTTEYIQQRVHKIQQSLPKGVYIKPYLIRDTLVNKTIKTVTTNLIEGGLIVVFILIVFLANLRAGLIVASVIPFAMLFAVSMMRVFGISANLMSLGAIDFGLIVDGAIIIVEAIVHRLHSQHTSGNISSKAMDKHVIRASQKIRKSAAFGEIIILVVYLPILALVGIEGKMFKPMAQTVALAIIGALLLSITYVPMISALFLSKKAKTTPNYADKAMAVIQKRYTTVLKKAIRYKKQVVLGSIFLFMASVFCFTTLGSAFMPVLEEGDLAMQQILSPGSSLSQSVAVSKKVQKLLKTHFPEIKQVVTKIGSAEIPTDPMPVEIGDYTLVMQPKHLWKSAKNKEALFKKIEEKLAVIPGVGYAFSQPIQMRFNELMTGSKADIAIKLYGDNLDSLTHIAEKTVRVLKNIKAIETVKAEQNLGMPQLVVTYNYDKLAQYGLQVKPINTIIRTAFAGEKQGVIYQKQRQLDLVLRFTKNARENIETLKQLRITTNNHSQIPLEEVADITFKEAPMQIARDNANRRIGIGVNTKVSDIGNLIQEIQKEIDKKIDLPTGYYFNYGGQFENYTNAKNRLLIAVPVALLLIITLLYITFYNIKQALLVFVSVALSAIGGVLGLLIRDMPFSISAGIGFIALFGVAVLNGIVLISHFNQLEKQGVSNVLKRVLVGTKNRLRPILMTASVASLGFLPMALSSAAGAEVQRPLATVVIAGLCSATILTLFIIPVLYVWLYHFSSKTKRINIQRKK